MSVEGPLLYTSERISRIGRVRTPEDTPTYSSIKQVPLISPPGSVPFEGIADEQIMEITIPYGISLDGPGESCEV